MTAFEAVKPSRVVYNTAPRRCLARAIATHLRAGHTMTVMQPINGCSALQGKWQHRKSVHQVLQTVLPNCRFLKAGLCQARQAEYRSSMGGCKGMLVKPDAISITWLAPGTMNLLM